jgi:glutathione peroxidase
LRTLNQETDDLTVLGFPCNQFGAQEPGSDEEILEFVTSKYDIDFPMFSKIEVNGDNTCELYKILKSEQPAEDGSEDLPWNFTKFLVDKNGCVMKRFNPQITPEEIKEELHSLISG